MVYLDDSIVLVATFEQQVTILSEDFTLIHNANEVEEM